MIDTSPDIYKKECFVMSHSNRSTGGAITGAIGGFAIMLGISRMLQVGFSD